MKKLLTTTAVVALLLSGVGFAQAQDKASVSPARVEAGVKSTEAAKPEVKTVKTTAETTAEASKEEAIKVEQGTKEVKAKADKVEEKTGSKTHELPATNAVTPAK